MRALSLGDDGSDASQALHLALRDQRPLVDASEEARTRIVQLAGECSDLTTGRDLHGDVQIERTDAGTSIRSHPEDEAFAECFRTWAPGYLAGLPRLTATLPR